MALFDDNSPEARFIQAVRSLIVTDAAKIEDKIRVQKEEVANATDVLAEGTTVGTADCLSGVDCTKLDTATEEMTTNEDATTSTTDEVTTDTTTDVATNSNTNSDLPQFSYQKN